MPTEPHTMNVDRIVEEAKKELARVEAEAARLRAIIAAAEGKAPAPALPSPNSVPVLVPYIVPLGPDYVHEPLRWLRLDDVTCSGGVLGQPADFTWTTDPTGTQVGGILPEPGGPVYGPGPTIDNSIRYGSH